MGIGRWEISRWGRFLLLALGGLFLLCGLAAAEGAPGDFMGLPIHVENGEARFEGFHPTLTSIEGDQFVSHFPNGVTVFYTLDLTLQRTMEGLFRQYRVPYGAFVAMDPNTGRVLALVEYSSVEAKSDPLTLRATFPAASIFKLVTASALLQERKITPDTVFRFRGGIYRLGPRNWTDDPRRDRQSMTFADALAKSCNVVFAKAALHYLDSTTLLHYAQAYRFNQPIPFELPVQVSHAEIEDNPKSLAYSAAGFGDVELSPLHGALIAASIADGGQMMSPYFISKIVGPAGEELFVTQPKPLGMAISQETAQVLRGMMATTVVKGTSRKAFRPRKGHALPRGITIGGKTGSLTGDDPKGKYSWFVGMAPVEAPEIAVAALVINRALWRVKSSFVAREGFSAYFRPDLFKAGLVKKASSR